MHKNDSNKKWFAFDIHSQASLRSVVSFDTEKRKLLQTIVNSTDEDCEIKNSKLGASNDIIINQNWAVKKVKLSFPKASRDVPV